MVARPRGSILRSSSATQDIVLIRLDTHRRGGLWPDRALHLCPFDAADDCPTAIRCAVHDLRLPERRLGDRRRVIITALTVAAVRALARLRP